MTPANDATIEAPTTCLMNHNAGHDGNGGGGGGGSDNDGSDDDGVAGGSDGD